MSDLIFKLADLVIVFKSIHKCEFSCMDAHTAYSMQSVSGRMRDDLGVLGALYSGRDCTFIQLNASWKCCAGKTSFIQIAFCKYDYTNVGR